MTTSADISQAFYDQLGAAALAARTTSAWDRQIIARVLHLLQPGQRVLDVGCGYGRIAVPVAVAGYPEASIVNMGSSCRTKGRTHYGERGHCRWQRLHGG